jgi:uncharacterized membrane protein YbhN (UPF0104 family)
VWRLLRSSDPAWIGAAAAIGLAVVAVRGLRLKLLLPAATIDPLRAATVAAAAQAAALFVPARAGELALPWLLRRSCGWDPAAGIGVLLAARTLDLAALGAWAAASAVLLFGITRPVALMAAAVLLLSPLLLPLLSRGLELTALRCAAPRGVGGRRWARRMLALVRAISELRRRPGRLAAAALMSLLMWGGVWAYTWCLLVAMGFHWPAVTVVAGSATASVANLIPVNLIANLGTLEAGWTAAFTALGRSVEEAARSGLAAHLWALLLAAVYGALAWTMVFLCGDKNPANDA